MIFIKNELRQIYLAAIMAAILLFFNIQTCAIAQMKVFLMLYNNGLILLYWKMQARGSKWPKRIMQAAILENGGYRPSATNIELAPSKILIYTLIRTHRHITLHLFIKTATRLHMLLDYLHCTYWLIICTAISLEKLICL